MGLFFGKKTGSSSIGKSASSKGKRIIKDSNGGVLGWVKDGEVYNSVGHRKGSISENTYNGRTNVKDLRGQTVGYVKGREVFAGGHDLGKLSQHSGHKVEDGAAMILLMGDKIREQQKEYKENKKHESESKGNSEKYKPPTTGLRGFLYRNIMNGKSSDSKSSSRNEEGPSRGYYT